MHKEKNEDWPANIRRANYPGTVGLDGGWLDWVLGPSPSWLLKRTVVGSSSAVHSARCKHLNMTTARRELFIVS